MLYKKEPNGLIIYENTTLKFILFTSYFTWIFALLKLFEVSQVIHAIVNFTVI